MTTLTERPSGQYEWQVWDGGRLAPVPPTMLVSVRSFSNYWYIGEPADNFNWQYIKEWAIHPPTGGDLIKMLLEAQDLRLG